MTHCLRLLCLLLLSYLVAGCVHTLAPGTTEWTQQQQAASLITYWQLDGKLGIKSPQETGALHLAWQQRDDAYDITLSGPLGSHATHLQGNATRLRVAQGDESSEGAPQAMLDQALGWAFPIEHIRYWVRGLPAPAAHTAGLEWQDGRLSHLIQSGWDITFAQYVTVAALHAAAPQSATSVALPSRITARHDDVTLTIVIHQWTTLAPEPLPATSDETSSDASHH